ncbi:Pilus assembly protein CpaC [Georgfuchsia toluolica]|uniref:Pilus assembly protein CpaC n=1 Tax=Georgfuchsia toluolica TaxID=424218 RepID=A0A916MZG0_9PROT|nr:type II and III secretion system protein family protein [Georgfuchsia toluolica]CAG4882906.1 Pilus assembly protein CpaC [Georgfuchsia toluolica]
MNKNDLVSAILATLVCTSSSFAAAKRIDNPPPPPTAALKHCTSVTVDDATHVVLGKSTVVKLSTPVIRMVVGGQSSGRAGKPVEAAEDKNAPPGQRPATRNPDGIADVEMMLLSPTELYFLGKRAGSMNVVLQSADGRCLVKDVIVTIDPGTLQAKLSELMPEETGVRVRGAENALVLIGKVSNAAKLDDIMSLATSYGDGKRVVNLLRTGNPQQVMLEVKIAEVSKTLLDKLGASVAYSTRSSGGTTYSLLSSFLSEGGGLIEALKAGKFKVNIDGQKDDGLVRILAEPNIMAISGQQASFLSGGKIFIPVSQSGSTGFGSVPTITLEEKEFGIGVKFTPTVLDGSRVNLKMVSEVSDLSEVGSPFATVNGVTSVLPSFTVRRADTTVQLNDGQSFVVAGLIKNNAAETIKRFPGLGEIPIIGALFRSSEFKKDQTELMFVITPRLVKPLPEAPTLPTDNHVEPSRSDVYFKGSLEGSTPPPAPAPAAPAPPVSVPAPEAPAAEIK